MELDEHLYSAGYRITVVNACPMDVGMPITRPRVFLVALHMPQLCTPREAPRVLSQAYVDLAVQAWVNKLKTASHALDADTFLLAEESEALEFWLASNSTRSVATCVDSTYQWQQKHDTEFSYNGIHRPTGATLSVFWEELRNAKARSLYNDQYR